MDSLVCGLINLVMGIPHMLLLILISYSLGKGFPGCSNRDCPDALGVAGEAFAGGNLTDPGKSVCADLRKTGEKALVDCLEPHRPAGIAAICDRVILLFPHAILHEAGVTFLGFGLSSEHQRSVLFYESMSYLITGKWWLALFPGAALVLVTLGFQAIGQSLGRLMDPGSAHE